MIAGEVVRTGFGEIRRHTLRSTLTLLGIILGTLSITVMLAFLEGVVGAIRQAYSEDLRPDIVRIWRRWSSDPREAARLARWSGLRLRDAGILASSLGDAAAVAPRVGVWATIRTGRQGAEVYIEGVTPAFADVRGVTLASGRFFSDLEEGTAARVCILTHDLRRNLFGASDPIGATVRVDGRPFRVIGVERRRGNDLVDELFHRRDYEGLFVPLSTLRNLVGTWGSRDSVDEITIRARDPARAGDLVAAIDALLTRAHHGARDFDIRVAGEAAARSTRHTESLIRSWIIVLGSVAVVSLLVGGIGLLSVMLISINERFHEIGLRKALGATGRDLFVQFLAEAVALATAGGLLGVLAGLALTRTVAGYYKAGLPLHPGTLLLAVGVAALVGALYGIYPALRAARLHPVEALRAAG